MPPEVRPAAYEGPTELPVELSETDKKTIVTFYSESMSLFALSKYLVTHVAILLGTVHTCCFYVYI